MLKIRRSEVKKAIERSNAAHCYFSRKTGKLVSRPVFFDPAVKNKLFKDMKEHPDDYMPAPPGYGFDELKVREKYSNSLADANLKKKLLKIVGKDDLRAFDKLLKKHGRQKEFTVFRERELKEFMEGWARDAEVELIDP